MRDINRSAVLEIIRREGPISRTAIAERLDVSLPTVMRIVEELGRRFRAPAGHQRMEWWEAAASAGIQCRRLCGAGGGHGRNKMYGAISDLGGHILDEVNISRHGTSGRIVSII